MWQLKEYGMAEAWFIRDGLPLWLAALVLAAVAPWCVRALAAHLEQRVTRRTRRVIEAVAESRKGSGAGEG